MNFCEVKWRIGDKDIHMMIWLSFGCYTYRTVRCIGNIFWLKNFNWLLNSKYYFELHVSSFQLVKRTATIIASASLWTACNMGVLSVVRDSAWFVVAASNIEGSSTLRTYIRWIIKISCIRQNCIYVIIKQFNDQYLNLSQYTTLYTNFSYSCS